MQSGITASTELHDAFKNLLTSTSQRAVLATIQNESLIPTTTIPSTSSTTFKSDLSALQPHLTPTAALYILLKLTPDTHAAITYVPNAAPVRQKMLFASTRLTLVRALGIEHFSQTVFATEAAELTAEGWDRHEAHESLAAPLTEEEVGLRGAKDAEAAESFGTMGRRGHVQGPGAVDVKTNEGVVEAIGLLREEGCKGTLVQLRYQLPGEVLTLESTRDEVQPEDVVGLISSEEPRYGFYSHPGARDGVEIVFMYTCPSKSRVKERMIYSTGKSWTRIVAERDAGITISRTLEATEPNELVSELVSSNGTAKQEGEAVQETKPSANSFARPKRPGRR